jgi:cytochrome c556
MKKTTLLLIGLIAGSTLSAALPDPVAVRKDGFHTLGAAFKNVNDELKSGTPQPFIMKLSVKQILASATAQYGWFPKGSEPREGVKTAARAEIWSQPLLFKKAQDAFAAQAQAFAKLPVTTEVTQYQAAAKLLGQTCAACHKSFRTEDKK